MMVCFGLYIDICSNIRMTGTTKIAIYVTPMTLLFINMIIGIKNTNSIDDKEKIKKHMLWMIFVIYIISISTLLFLDSAYRYSGHLPSGWDRVNLIPFKEITECLSGLFSGNISIKSALVSIGGNLLAFVPMGFFIPVLLGSRIKNIKQFTLLMIIITSAVELTQFITKTGISDIDDVILNTLGAVIVYLLVSRFKRIENFCRD